MFQYAIARALSERYQTAFALNRTWFDVPQVSATPRELQLSLLNIQNVPFTSKAFPKKPGKITSSLQKFLPTQSVVIYQRNAFDFDANLLNLKNINYRDLYLNGYWQSFSYFKLIRPILQQEFKIPGGVSHEYQGYLEQIKSKESVMIHVRRGDYVHSSSASQIHGALPLNYYLKAIKVLSERKLNLHFFIFSDDLDWAKATLPSEIQKTFIEHSASSSAVIHELQLMTACKNHIIANSSLSWWGAWLKQNSSGLVLTPNRWINDGTQDLSHLLPPDWIQISAQ